ncbi:hypothetical protein L596_028208 [Steinernema carpocapsae]|uniref:Saposin B-type domain-containing protein n=1 Tax=Steinernema carpocapsae TaxID=34508 RepID=A0A4U5LXR8_STECR|nr:hypothetical protein L596_028208 [Steinernema carpocapsae]
MRPRHLLAFLSFSFTVAFPTTFSTSEQCTACLFAAHLLKGNAGSALKLFNTCEQIEGCNAPMEHCEILAGLPELPPKGTSKVVDTLHVTIGSAKTLCEKDSKQAVFMHQDVLCTICSLVENILRFFNNAVFGSKFEDSVRKILLEVCNFRLVQFDPLCAKLFFKGDLFNDIFTGLRNSLGEFYNILGVEGMGCPALDQLQNVCFST